MKETQLPRWYGLPRGTMASSTLGDGIELGRDSGHRRAKSREQGPLNNILNDGISSFVGFATPFAALSLIAVAAGAPDCALFAFAAAGWALVCVSAAYLVHTHEQNAPPWACAFMGVLPIWGRVAAVALVIAAILLILLVRIVCLLFELAARSA